MSGLVPVIKYIKDPINSLKGNPLNSAADKGLSGSGSSNFIDVDPGVCDPAPSFTPNLRQTDWAYWDWLIKISLVKWFLWIFSPKM